MGKKWQIADRLSDDIIEHLIKSRGITIDPPNPLTPPKSLSSMTAAIARIRKAISRKESIVVYADYDADGICAGAIMWETLWSLGARVMPYIPHRADEGYGLSTKGIDAVRAQHDPTLIITVDHGITARDMVAYAKKFGIEVIVTDHHVKPKKLPDCTIVHTTDLAGSGVSWFLANALSSTAPLELAAIGTIADLVPLVGPNRSIVKYGLEALRKTKRKGILSLLSQAGVDQKDIAPYTISHMLAPRLNAMGRLEHALDALRLLCTKDEMKAKLLAEKLSFTNTERQKLTEEMFTHANNSLQGAPLQKLIFISHQSYNQGVIGLVAGRLVEAYYRPAIVLAVDGDLTKASARSISGFNIVEAIRTASDLLIDVGGHPMAAGFTVETKNLEKLQKKLEAFAEKMLDDDALTRKLHIDAEIPLSAVSEKLWKDLQELAPFGIGNPEPVFATRDVEVVDSRLVGKEGKHLKLRISSKIPKSPNAPKLPIFDCIAFNLGSLFSQLKSGTSIDLAYTIDMNEWNGKRSLQLKVKDIISSGRDEK